ncbi:hypothetical protein N7462_007865 [Penicillium macrosclerotiorum]|uniref:uncharacterized protein n=1 Tax=Penicillium macrosclerotiorum TaxID=303699 RepID=UPI0025490CEF|nr:uncharacterized protein N7462_007865 [Penicillium macrosclerotiorum]KAJ5679621.1 hypothetical protein N7462_007865 [Penicillium macrosclerotiorum]
MAKSKEPGSRLITRAEAIARDFDLSPNCVRRITKHFVDQIKDGLENDRPWQLPAYLRSIPTGSEKGQFLAVDLGGSNCRICMANLHGDSTFSVSQSKHRVPRNIMVNDSYLPLFDFIAQKIAEFLDTSSDPDSQLPHKLGFTFSFTCEQISLNSGRLIRWDKGWDIPDAIGCDPCVLLQEAIDRLGLAVRVVVLANDSVGTLLTRSYSSGQKISTLGAVIFGTGTNAAYVEKLSNVRRLGENVTDAQGIMVINSEWGSFDDKMEVLPRTPFDDKLDAESGDPGSQMLEKRVSGLYLGELLRLSILQLFQENLFSMTLHEVSEVCQHNGINSSLLSQLVTTEPYDSDSKAQVLQKALSVENVSAEDVAAIQLIARSITRRAARLAGASLSAIIIQSGRLKISSSEIENRPFRRAIPFLSFRFKDFYHCAPPLARHIFDFVKFVCKGLSSMLPKHTSALRDMPLSEEIIDIGADGSLIEFYPMFETDMRGAVREIPEIGGAGEKRIRISLTKDGSGVGAALMAYAAGLTEKQPTLRCGR